MLAGGEDLIVVIFIAAVAAYLCVSELQLRAPEPSGFGARMCPLLLAGLITIQVLRRVGDPVLRTGFIFEE